MSNLLTEKTRAFPDIPKEKLRLVQKDRRITDQKLETKSIGYFKDVWLRFKRDKSAVVAFVLIMILLLFSMFVPFFSKMNVSFREENFSYMLPKAFSNTGFWDGTFETEQSQGGYDIIRGIGMESGLSPIAGKVESYTAADGTTRYKFRQDSYYTPGYEIRVLSEADYKALMAYQDETHIQILFPIPVTWNVKFNGYSTGNYWYKLRDERPTSGGEAVYDENGNYIPNYLTSPDPHAGEYDSIRMNGDNGGEDGKTWYTYAMKVQGGYRVRLHLYRDFTYRNGFEPGFIFGTNLYGQDIFSCLAYGGRLSFILAISVCLINFVIGAIYGAIEGYYGGTTDIIMERISDILGYMPFIVIATLFKLHLQEQVGPLVSLLFAFVMTGWIGMASRVRMQFYRFKGHEYVLAARTLGARDRRLIFKHIFPNSLGTIITGSVLAIPGVIFSESMLSYLGIINLNTSSMTSIGTMLSNGHDCLRTYPHVILFPAMFISILEISFNLFGNGLRDAFNPSLRGADN